MNLNRYPLIVLLLMVFTTISANAQEQAWPRTVMLDEGMVTVYAPQLEAMDGGVLYYRAALAYRPDADAEPVFGAGWLKSEVDIDEKQDIVSPRGMSLTQTRFPDGTSDIEAELATALSRQSARWNLDFTVAELEAALDAAEAETLAAQKLKTAPPKIIYRDRPALLVTIDGEPVLRGIEDSPYQAVINTPFPLITDGRTYYLNAARNAWYRADRATGPYRFDTRPPQDIVTMVESGKQESENSTASETPEKPITAENAPEIVVTTEPAELIVTDGPADFIPLVEDLLVLKNSPEDVFMHVGEQKYYIVLAGRWYQAPSLDGPWENQSANDLPIAFSKIPTDSPQAESRVYVAGTPEAEEAVLDAHVPQTAAVKRGEVDITVDYDGEPDFERVEGTDDLYYAENTGATVLESDQTYYLLEDGVWYVATSPHGPWVVSDHRPGELESVEPSSPVYNTKYVYVYDSTPEVVYVGYTPGYVGSYVYGPTLVYGTGYYYRPWISPYYYYPRFRTWGWSVGYSSYGGWSFGFGGNYGGWNLSYYSGGYWHHGRPWYNRYYGYWGPRGYCPTPYYGGYYGHNPYGKRYAYNRGYRHGYRDGYGDGSYYDPGYGDRGHRGGDYDRGRGGGGYHDGRQRNRNLYRDGAQRAQVVQTRDTWSSRPDRNSKPAPGQFGRGEQRYAENRKVRRSTAGPVSRTDIRNKAKVRDINRTASREPMVASAAGEVKRAEFGSNSHNRPQRGPEHRTQKDNKIRKSRTAPVSRDELRQRGEVVASRPSRSKTAVSRQSREPSVAVNQSAKRKNRQAVTEPGRRVAGASTDESRHNKRSKKSRQQVTTPARKVSSRSSEHRSDRAIASVPREVQRNSSKSRSSRQVVSQPRQVGNSNSKNRSSRQAVTVPREAEKGQSRSRSKQQGISRPREVQRRASTRETVRQRDPQPQQKQQARTEQRRQVQQARVQQPRVRKPSMQKPRVQQPRAQQRSAPAPRPQQRSAPRPQQRSAPPPGTQQKSVPRQAPQRSNARPQSRPSRNRNPAQKHSRS